MFIKLKTKYGKLKEYLLSMSISYIDSIEEDSECKVFLPTYDCIFKKMFIEEETKKYACLLLSTVLDIDIDKMQKEMILIRNEMNPRKRKGRSVRVDFVGKVEDVIFNIEMNQTNKLERNIDYANRLYTIENTKKK